MDGYRSLIKQSCKPHSDLLLTVVNAVKHVALLLQTTVQYIVCTHILQRHTEFRGLPKREPTGKTTRTDKIVGFGYVRLRCVERYLVEAHLKV